PHRSPGGVFSPRSGRRSPIRVLSGGQAARTNPTPATTARRLTSRQVPDCLRCPTEERTHPRPDHPEPQPAPPTPAPNRPRPLSEEGPASGGFESLSRSPPRHATGWEGGQAEPGDAKRRPQIT